MKNIALIACSNGYGHTRRILCISSAFREIGYNTVIFAEIEKVKKLCKIMGISCPTTIDFNTQTDLKFQLHKKIPNWINRIKNLDNFDYVISDNLLEILELRKDSLISGSFLWHKSLSNFPENKKKYYQRLIEKYNPKIFSSSFFTSDYLKEYKNLYEVGLFALGEKRKGIKKNILISAGKGGNVNQLTKSFILKVSKNPKPNFINKLYIEPNTYKKDMPKWIQPAKYTDKMYSSLSSAIIRPGAGTITDCIINNVRMFCFYEEGNFEMKSNSIKIQNSNLGYNSVEIKKAWEDSLKWNQSKIGLNGFKNIDLNGSQSIVKIILNS
tara:strand:+ start:1440 stop:2417 length:978 start_codon:yes stop_codon:yes gene_type:complete